jgi:phage baseplate assembly protein W
VDGDLRDAAFLGIGWAFPPRLDPTGDVAVVAFEEDVRQAVRIILMTDPGERVMRPDFGSGLRALLFEPTTEATRALVRHRIEEALIRWEPRIDSITVEVRAPASSARLDIEIHYRVRSTNTFYNIVYPFYLLEGDRT